ncbi:MAG: hypothetical protein PHI98_03720 [Eubacteriales bacterium]|nr:hypothetical protein [Eubacteriales bacterium]
MEQHAFPIVLSLILFFYFSYAIYQEYQQRRREQLRVKKIYASPLFEDLLPILKGSRKRAVEQISIDKTGILFTYLSPVGSHTAFLVKNYGYPYLTPEQQDAMRIVLEECLPKIRDHKNYRLYRRSVRLINGNVEYIYCYTMQNHYKIKLNRAPYYDTAMRTRIP